MPEQMETDEKAGARNQHPRLLGSAVHKVLRQHEAAETEHSLSQMLLVETGLPGGGSFQKKL